MSEAMLDAITYWQEFITELRAIGEGTLTLDALRSAFPLNHAHGHFEFNRNGAENNYISDFGHMFIAKFVLFMFEKRIKYAHQARDQESFEFLIQQPIADRELANLTLEVPYLTLVAHQAGGDADILTVLREVREEFGAFHRDLLLVIRTNFYKQLEPFPDPVKQCILEITLKSGSLRMTNNGKKRLFGTRRPTGIRRSKGIQIPMKLDVKIGEHTESLKLAKRNYFVTLYNGYAQLMSSLRGAQYNNGRAINLFVALTQIREKQNRLVTEIDGQKLLKISAPLPVGCQSMFAIYFSINLNVIF